MCYFMSGTINFELIANTTETKKRGDSSSWTHKHRKDKIGNTEKNKISAHKRLLITQYETEFHFSFLSCLMPEISAIEKKSAVVYVFSVLRLREKE